jgi:hypothetical protein
MGICLQETEGKRQGGTVDCRKMRTNTTFNVLLFHSLYCTVYSSFSEKTHIPNIACISKRESLTRTVLFQRIKIGYLSSCPVFSWSS